MSPLHIILILLNIVTITFVIMLVRTYRFVPNPIDDVEVSTVTVDTETIAQHLSGAIQCVSISRPDPALVDWTQFDALRNYLKETYPMIHEKLEWEVIAEHSLLYTWRSPSPQSKPLALLAHMDVVPVMPGTEDDWEHGAFSGHVDDEFIWGRGALDMKGQLISICETVEKLLSEDYVPDCDIYLCFGHNEEVVGSEGGGAQMIAETLKERQVKLGLVVDEGGAIVPGSMFNIPGQMAAVGIAEKGYADIKVTAVKPGGHSSQPPKDNGLVQLGQLMVNLDRHPMKARFTDTVSSLFNTVGPHMGFGMRLMLSNLWLTRPIVLKALANSPTTNAMIRTTITPTMAEGSPAGNVLPQTANININSRVLQGEKIQHVLDHIRAQGKGMDIQLEVPRGKEPSAISPTNDAFQTVAKSVREVYGNIPVAPYLMVGGTDSCFYEIITDHIYCVSPFMMEQSDLKRIHATNERISKENLANGVRFFIRLIENYTQH